MTERAKHVGVKELQADASGCLRASQRRRVIVTRYGKPCAAIIGLEGVEWDEVELAILDRARAQKGRALVSQEVLDRMWFPPEAMAAAPTANPPIDLDAPWTDDEPAPAPAPAPRKHSAAELKRMSAIVREKYDQEQRARRSAERKAKNAAKKASAAR